MLSHNSSNKLQELINILCPYINNENRLALTELLKQPNLNLNLIKDKSTLLLWLIERKETQAVEFLIEAFKLNCHDAAYFYARLGNTDKVNAQIAKGAKQLHAIQGYNEGGFLTKENIFRILACTNNGNLRLDLLNKTEENINEDSLDLDILYSEATQINKFMNQFTLFKLTFDEVPSLRMLSAGNKTWLLQATQLVNENRYGLIEDVFDKINALLLNLSIHHAKIVFNYLHDVYDQSPKKDSFFSSLKFWEAPKTNRRLLTFATDTETTTPTIKKK